MLKCVCSCCGYTVRISRKWLLLAGAPLCPSCKISLTAVTEVKRAEVGQYQLQYEYDQAVRDRQMREERERPKCELQKPCYDQVQ